MQVDEDVLARRPAEDVVPGATEQVVVTGASVHQVVAGAADEEVVASVPADEVAAVMRPEPVIPVAAMERVAPRAAVDQVVARPAERSHDRAFRPDRIVAWASLDFDRTDAELGSQDDPVSPGPELDSRRVDPLGVARHEMRRDGMAPRTPP